MLYVMSDIHGCYDQYIKMLHQIGFGNGDTLYVLGDVVDRGDDGIKILWDMMHRNNVIPLLGNHEYMAYSVMKKCNVELTADNFHTLCTKETMEMYQKWMFNGGIPTIQQFLKLDKAKRESITEYLGEFELYEELTVNENRFVLVHAGLNHFKESKPLHEYDIRDMIWEHCDYTRQYYKDQYLVTGHTPTFLIDEKYRGKIYRDQNNIAIDCGAVYGGSLGCICLNTLEEFYV